MSETAARGDGRQRSSIENPADRIICSSSASVKKLSCEKKPSRRAMGATSRSQRWLSSRQAVLDTKSPPGFSQPRILAIAPTDPDLIGRKVGDGRAGL